MQWLGSLGLIGTRISGPSPGIPETTTGNPAPVAAGPSFAAIAVAVGFCALLLYHVVRPTVIPGIPHNPVAGSLLGDVPSLRRHIADGGSLSSWFALQPALVASPVTQVFLRPLSFLSLRRHRPFVLVADYLATHDAIVRRPREFDRATTLKDVIAPLVPFHQIVLGTWSGRWRAHRRLMQDLMLPSYLDAVAMPDAYENASKLVDLWKTKASLAPGRVFRADEDITFSTLDGVLAFVFGGLFPFSATRPHMELLASMDPADLERLQPSGGDGGGGGGGGGGGVSGNPEEMAVFFPRPPPDETITATVGYTKLAEDLQLSPFPWLTAWAANRRPSYARMRRVIDDYVKAEVLKSVAKMEASESKSEGEDRNDGEKGRKGEHDFSQNQKSWIGSAVDHMIARERQLAAQDGRDPVYWSRDMHDEVYGLVVAGHDTTGTTIQWAVKLLADHPTTQARLRSALRHAYPLAAAERRPPTLDEVRSGNNGSVPYLDATVEEVLRVGLTSPFVARDATVDTEILGYPIPKGTSVVFLANAQSVLSPAFELSEEARARGGGGGGDATGRDKNTARMQVGNTSEEDMAAFAPERWLLGYGQHGADGRDVFRGNSWAQLQFGLGVRGCFGRRLAYRMLKTTLTLLVWSFDLRPVPSEELRRYSAVDGLTHRPTHCYVRLGEPDWDKP